MRKLAISREGFMLLSILTHLLQRIALETAVEVAFTLCFFEFCLSLGKILISVASSFLLLPEDNRPSLFLARNHE